jgi:hypothetical protein
MIPRLADAMTVSFARVCIGFLHVKLHSSSLVRLSYVAPGDGKNLLRATDGALTPP